MKDLLISILKGKDSNATLQVELQTKLFASI